MQSIGKMKNIIKIYLWALIKRFVAMFVTMAVLSAIGVTSIIAFNGMANGLKENYDKYLVKSNAPDAFVTTELKNYQDLESGILSIDGIENCEKSIFLPCSTYLDDKEETKSGQIFTFDRVNDVYKPQIKEEVSENHDTLPSIYVESSFAKLNDIHTKQIISIGYYEQYVQVYVKGIISYPDTIMYGASNAVSTENTNFGRLYLDKEEVKEVLKEIIDKLNQFVIDNPNIKQSLKDQILAQIAELEEYRTSFADETKKFANRLLVYFSEGYDQNKTLTDLKTYLSSQNIQILESYLFSETLSASVIASSSKAMTSAGRAISIFVFSTTIVVLTMFLLQIIREMMRDIGVMSALGVQKTHINVLLALFSFIISIIGTAFGILFGHLIEFGLDTLVGSNFGVEIGLPPFRWGSVIISFILVIVASQFATFFASFRITRLTPVDALNDQATKKKVLPSSIDKKLKKASPGIRLTVNSIVTKPKRFIISFFAIFASGVIIFTSMAALTSFKSAINNTFEKYIRYDAQVVFANDVGNFEEELNNIIGTGNYERSLYAQPTLTYNGKSETIALQGLNVDTDKVVIPVSKNKTASIPNEGITVNMITARNLGINAGDTILLNNKEVNVAYISKLETYNICFCNIDRIKDYVSTAVNAYLINGVDKEALIKQVTNYHYDALVTLTKDQRNFFSSRFKTLEIICSVFIAFSIGLGVLIVSLMMQTSLAEQKRDLCIMRSIGFSMGQISLIWSIVTILQYVLSMIVAIPLSFLATDILLNFVATNMAMVLSYANFTHVLLTCSLVGLFLIIAHLFCMLKVKRWNIADNTKSRE